MNCEDFLRQFRDALDGKVSESVIQENVRYYRSYISSQTAGGKSESEVLGMLGDPRLLAKTIEESSRFASGKDSQDGYAGGFGSSYANAGNTSYYRNNFENHYGNNSAEHGYTETSDDRRTRIPGWLITCIVLVVVLVVLSVVFRVFLVLAPYILVFLLAGFLVRAVRSWWQRK